jgi:hypothetical protein
MHDNLSAQVRAHIDRLAKGTSGAAVEEAARKFDALPLYEGWDGWGVLTEQGQVLEATDAGAVSPAEDPMRTMYLVKGSETYPELRALLPIRSSTSIDCAHCKGSGWMCIGEATRFRCGECRALGWVEVPSNTSLERTRGR